MSRLTFKKQSNNEEVNCACINNHTYMREVDGERENYYLIGECIDKLADYEDKQEQGLLIELPCKVGDRVYFIVGKDISVQKVMSIQLLSNNRIEIYTKRRVLNGNDFGKTVFLTRSEAEEALAKMGGK